MPNTKMFTRLESTKEELGKPKLVILIPFLYVRSALIASIKSFQGGARGFAIALAIHLLDGSLSHSLI